MEKLEEGNVEEKSENVEKLKEENVEKEEK